MHNAYKLAVDREGGRAVQRKFILYPALVFLPLATGIMREVSVSLSSFGRSRFAPTKHLRVGADIICSAHFPLSCAPAFFFLVLFLSAHARTSTRVWLKKSPCAPSQHVS